MSTDLLQLLEENGGRKVHLVLAGISIVLTSLMWWIHLTHPGMFPDPFLRGSVNRARLIVAIAPPFLFVFCLANAFSMRSEVDKPSGPMSGYLQQQESDRRWKISVAAGIAAAANLLFLMATSG